VDSLLKTADVATKNMAESCDACGRTGMDLTNIKGDKGDTGAVGAPGTNGVNGTNGTNGTNGRSISTITHVGNQWIVTFDDATTTSLTEPLVGAFYAAWADDAAGNGFTLAPSNTGFMALVTTISGGIPVASDFAGQYFMINQPTLEFKQNTNADFSHNTVTADVNEALGAPYTAPTIPYAFLSTPGAEFEIEIDWLSIPTVLTSSHILNGDLNGTAFQTGVLNATDASMLKTVIKARMSTATTATGTVTTTVHNPNLAPWTTDPSGVSSQLLNIPISADLVMSLTSVFAKSGNPTLTVRSIFVTAYNSAKTTI